MRLRVPLTQPTLDLHFLDACQRSGDNHSPPLVSEAPCPMCFHARFQDFLRSVIDRICSANYFGLFATAPPPLCPAGSSVGGRGGGIARLPWARDLTHTDHATVGRPCDMGGKRHVPEGDALRDIYTSIDRSTCLRNSDYMNVE